VSGTVIGFLIVINLYCQNSSIVSTQYIIVTAMMMDADLSVSLYLPPFIAVSLSHAQTHSLYLLLVSVCLVQGLSFQSSGDGVNG
jgi:hypothetical protein